MNRILLKSPFAEGWTPEKIQELGAMHAGIAQADGVVPVGNGRFKIARLQVPKDADAAEISEVIAVAALGD